MDGWMASGGVDGVEGGSMDGEEAGKGVCEW